MKKFIFISLIPIFIYLIPIGILVGSFFVSGCAEDSPQRFKQVQTPDQENLFSYSRYPYINQILGYPSGEDWLRLWGTWNELSDRLVTEDQMELADHEMFTEMMKYLSAQFKNEEDKYNAALAENEVTSFSKTEDGIIDLMDMANYTGMGEVLNELFRQLGRDFLPHHVYPILQHYFTMDRDTTYKNLISSIDDSEVKTKLSQADFETLSEILYRMIDSQDTTYGPIWEAIPSAWDLIDRVKNYGGGVTVGDLKSLVSVSAIKDFLDSLIDQMDEGTDEEAQNLMEAISDALTEVWDFGTLQINTYERNEDGTLKFDSQGYPIPVGEPVTVSFQDEFRKLLLSAGLLMSQQNTPETYRANNANTWDNRNMADLSRVLYGVQDLLTPSKLPREKIESFANNILAASANMDGSNSLSGILRGFAAADPAYLQGLDEAIDYLMTLNQNGNIRRDLGSNTPSALRSLLFLVNALDMNIGAGALIASNAAGGFTGLAADKNGTNPRPNMVSWAVGEISNALDRYPDNSFKGFDYLLYQKYYWIPLSLGLINADGLLGLLDQDFIDFILTIDATLNIVGIGDALPSAYVAIGAKPNPSASSGYDSKTGVMHQLLGPVGPIIPHYWKWNGAGKNWEHPVAAVLMAMNEFSSPTALTSDSGTGVLKTVEGPDGLGLAHFALRSRVSGSTDLQDTGVLDPVFTMLSMIVRELINTRYNYNGCTNPCQLYCDNAGQTCTLFSALVDYLGKNKIEAMGYEINVDKMDDQNEDGSYKVVSDLLDPDADGDTVIDTAQDTVTDFHDLIAIFAEDIGKVLIAATENKTRFDQIKKDIETISDILGKLEFNTDSTEGISDFIDYMLGQNADGSDNKLVANIKAILIKALDLKLSYYDKYDPNQPVGSQWNRTYLHEADEIDTIHNIDGLMSSNPYAYALRRAYYESLYQNIDNRAAWWQKDWWQQERIPKDKVKPEGKPANFVGSFDDSMALSDVFKTLFGEDSDLEGGKYSLSYARDFVSEISDSGLDIFGYVVMDGIKLLLTDGGDEENTFGTLGGTKYTMWDIYSYRFVTPTMFGEVDLNNNGIKDWTAMYRLLSMFDFEADMNGVLEDNILFWGGPDLRPGRTTYRVWYKIFVYYADGLNIFNPYDLDEINTQE